MPMTILALTKPALAAALALSALHAVASGAHQHGVGTLAISLEADRLTVTLVSPLDNLLGFERAPRYARDFEKVSAMAGQLRSPDRMLRPDAEAGCRNESVWLASSMIAPEKLGESAPAAPAAKAKDDGHGDLEARYVFRCSAPARLKRIEVGLFQAFPRLRTLNAQIVTPKRQAAARVTKRHAVLALP